MSLQFHFDRHRTLIPAFVAAVLLALAVAAPAWSSPVGLSVTAAPAAAPATATRPLPGPPTWPAHPQPITAAPAANDTHDASGLNWATIGLGLTGSLLAVGGIVALTRRRSRRVQRLRATP